jgi:hypothetical protein
MKLLRRLLCRLGLHDVAWTVGRGGLVRWEACKRDGCDWLVMRKGGRP